MTEEVAKRNQDARIATDLDDALGDARTRSARRKVRVRSDAHQNRRVVDRPHEPSSEQLAAVPS